MTTQCTSRPVPRPWESVLLSINIRALTKPMLRRPLLAMNSVAAKNTQVQYEQIIPDSLQLVQYEQIIPDSLQLVQYEQIIPDIL